MMNLEEIACRIKNPQLCGSNDIDELHQLSEKYPYAQVFSILYLKALSINNDVRFDDELQHHAFRITDRLRLYELINEKGANSNVSDLGALSKIEDIEIGQVEILTTEIEHELIDLEEEEEEEEEEIPTDETILEESLELIEPNIESEPFVEEDVQVEPLDLLKENEVDEIETQVKVEISEPINEVSQEEPIEIIENNKIEVPEILSTVILPIVSASEIISTIQEEDEIVDILTSNDELKIKESVDETPVLEEKEVEQKEEFSRIENDLEIEVLSHAIASNYTVSNVDESIKEEEIESEKIEEIEIIPQFSNYTLTDEPKTAPKKGFSSWLKANKNEVEREEIDPKTKINTLVNQFLKEEPSISRPKKAEKEVEKPKTEFFSPVKKARKSLDENTLPVSETLAKIFAAQGNFPKAIYAYEQLIAINPEKKIFFANQITELTKKLNT